jgi:hypothetical protein
MEADKVIFFRLSTFFLALRRLTGLSGASAVGVSIEASVVSASMDLFSFNLLHHTIDQFAAEKRWAGLEHSVKLLLEMTKFLWCVASP